MSICKEKLIKDVNKFLMENTDLNYENLKVLITNKVSKCTHIPYNEKQLTINSLYNAAINKKFND